MIKTKKGEISTAFIITVLLLILGFIIVLIFYFNLGGTKTLDDTVCHNSVIFRATLPSMVKDYIPLQCKTTKICVTYGLLKFGRGNCAEFEGETGVTTIILRTKNINNVEKIYADEILKCWTMMGEGKVSLFTQYAAVNMGLGDVYPSCVVCDRIAFDKEAMKDFDFSQMDLSRYMLEHKAPGKDISYFEAIGGKASVEKTLMKLNLEEKKDDKGKVVITESFQSQEAVSNVNVNSVSEGGFIEEYNKQKQNQEIQLRESAIVFMQISSPKQGESLVNLGSKIAIAGATSFIIAPSLTKSVVFGVARVAAGIL